MVSILALAESYGFIWVPHYVSVDMFEGVDEQLGPLLPVLSLGKFGSLSCVRHGRHANADANAIAILLLAQTV